jgi:hypothetical protein
MKQPNHSIEPTEAVQVSRNPLLSGGWLPRLMLIVVIET